jgi:GTPase-activator protein for Ras-like GTPase
MYPASVISFTLSSSSAVSLRYIYIYIYVCVCVHACVYMCMCPCVNVCVCVCVCVHVRVHVPTDSASLDRLLPSAVHFYDTHHLLLDLAQQAVSYELQRITSDALFFRGKTAASSLLSEFCRVAGGSYLQVTLAGTLKKLHRDGIFFPANLSALSASQQRDAIDGTRTLSDVILTRILASGPNLPVSVKKLLQHIQKVGSEHFPASTEKLLSGVIFLRFICPGRIVACFLLRCGACVPSS